MVDDDRLVLAIIDLVVLQPARIAEKTISMTTSSLDWGRLYLAAAESWSITSCQRSI